MKRTIYPGMLFTYWDLIIGHYIALVLIFGVFFSDIEQGFGVNLYSHVDPWWKMSTYLMVFILSLFMAFHLSGRPLTIFENGIAWFKNEYYPKRQAGAFGYILLALIFNPLTCLIYESHWILLIPNIFLIAIFMKEILYSIKLKKKIKINEAEETKIHSKLSQWINDYDFKAIDVYFKVEGEEGLSFEELLKMIIHYQSQEYLKRNYIEIKEAYYAVGWYKDSEPSGFDHYCDEVFHQVLNENEN